eukprot:7154-Heterococcus_DN1.PRE.5
MQWQQHSQQQPLMHCCERSLEANNDLPYHFKQLLYVRALVRLAAPRAGAETSRTASAQGRAGMLSHQQCLLRSGLAHSV